MEEKKLVSFYVTQKCGLSCSHCFGLGRDLFPDEELSGEDFCRVLDELPDIGVIRLLGGECLCEWDKVLEITRHASSLGKRTVILTNTELLNGERVRLLKEAGDCIIQVSCEGMGAVQDRVRGEGYFERVLWKVKLIREHSIRCNMVVTLTPHNIGQISDIYALAANLGIMKVVFSMVLNVNGRDGLQLSFGQFEKGIGELAGALRDRGGRKPVQIGFSPLLANYLYACDNPWLRENCGAEIAEAFHRLKKCVHQGKFCLFPNGDVYPCPFLPYLNNPLPPAGNIRKQPVQVIRRRIGEMFGRININDPECNNCNFFRDCGGGCRARVYRDTGSLDGTDRGCPVRAARV